MNKSAFVRSLQNIDQPLSPFEISQRIRKACGCVSVYQGDPLLKVQSFRAYIGVPCGAGIGWGRIRGDLEVHRLFQESLITKTIRATRIMHPMAITNNAPSSKTLRRMFWLDLHSWENVMLGSLAVAAVSASIVGVASWRVVVLTRAENAATKMEFEQYKVEAAERTAEANAAAAKANERAVILEMEVEHARAEQERLRAIAAWRRITKEQYETLVSRLRGKKIELEVTTLAGDPEAFQYWEDIVRTLKDAGLNPVASTRMQRAAGLSIFGDPLSIAALKDAFSAAGLPLGDSSAGERSPFGVTLIVGSKPPPF